jgi:hypothetical protein
MNDQELLFKAKEYFEDYTFYTGKTAKLALEQLNTEKSKMAYEEVNPTHWTYEKDGDFIEGVLVQKQEGIGENNSKLYSIETPNAGVLNVWGSAVLDSRMALIKEGSKVRITYKGLGEAKGGKNAPKIFKVEVDKSTF